jgi:hypothetical protein
VGALLLYNRDPLLITYAVEPSIPQNIKVKQNLLVERNSSCTVSIAWITPRNVAQDDVSHYIIYVNGTTNYYVLSNTTTNDPDQDLLLTTYPVCTCAEHQISVSAVDRCGREGERSPNIIPDRDPFSFTVTCEYAPSTNPGNCYS